ncbi:MAG: hypothetical protein ACRDTJ_12945, partial [Pseudonocardiaceae bacterium]
LVATQTTRTDRDFNRQHTSAPAVTCPLLRQLCENWVSTNTDPTAIEAVRRWAHDDTYAGTLRGLDSPGEIVDHIAASTPVVKDDVLRTLLTLVQDGERLAGEILLHTMLPALTRMPMRIQSPRGEDDYEETLQRILAEFWDVISTPRNISSSGVAGRLQMETLHQVTAHRRSKDVWEEHVAYNEDVWEDQSDQDKACPTGTPVDDSTPAPLYDELDPDSDIVGLLRSMLASGDFSMEETRLLTEVYVISGGNQREAAARLGISYAATRQRLTRLRNRLCAAVEADRLELVAAA